MKWTLIVASFGLAAVVSSSLALAGPPAESDQVLASFQRTLAHEPTPTNERLTVNQVADPLRQVISAVLWEKQRVSFHAAAREISAATPAHRH